MMMADQQRPSALLIWNTTYDGSLDEMLVVMRASGRSMVTTDSEDVRAFALREGLTVRAFGPKAILLSLRAGDRAP